MKSLTTDQITKLASRKGVKKTSVENFLFSMGEDPSAAWQNLRVDAQSYKWDSKTQKAISDGIILACKG